ncbi:hypothetical protein AGMMS4952_18840 [Spirochaetia bacterium]|nr:hypothetical protein AGMMS4952_18840 [Spirochaetia bacterium]
MQNTKWSSKELKEAGIFLAWIAGLFLIAGFAWFLSRPARTGMSIRNVNAALHNAQVIRILEAPLTDKSIPRLKAAKAAQLGAWYSLYNSEDRAVVFSIMAEGIPAPCVIFISPQGGVEGPVPLGVYSAQVLERLPPGVIQTYRNRLAAGAALLREKK